MKSEITYSRPDLWDYMDGGKPYEPFPWQAEHIHSRPDTQVIIAACGRRSGKTTAMLGEVIREAMKPAVTILGKTHHPMIYIIGPTSELSQKVWEPIWDAFVPPKDKSYVPPLGFLYKNHDKQRRRIWLKTGAVIQGKSADDPISLQGDRVTLAIPDESHSMPDEAWQYLLPSLLESGGRLLAIGVAKGKNRFRSMWELGQGEDPNYYSFSVPSWAHPLIFQTESEAEAEREYGKVLMRSDDPETRARGESLQHSVSLEKDPSYQILTEIEQRQMYGAEWVEDDGSVFSKDAIAKCATGRYLNEPDKDGVYIAGLDVAQKQDWTVLMIGDIRTGQIVHAERIQGIEYMSQAPRLANVCREWGIRFAHMDVTSNIAVAEIFREEGISIVDFVYSNQSKNSLVNVTIREMERGNITLPREDDVLLKELELFERKITPSGKIGFSAPPGYHDDMVDALCLLVAKMSSNRGMAKTTQSRSYVTFGNEGKAMRALMPDLPRPKVAV